MSPCAGATEYERELISVDSPNVVQCVGEMTHEADAPATHRRFGQGAGQPGRYIGGWIERDSIIVDADHNLFGLAPGVNADRPNLANRIAVADQVGNELSQT